MNARRHSKPSKIRILNSPCSELLQVHAQNFYKPFGVKWFFILDNFKLTLTSCGKACKRKCGGRM